MSIENFSMLMIEVSHNTTERWPTHKVKEISDLTTHQQRGKIADFCFWIFQNCLFQGLLDPEWPIFPEKIIPLNVSC